MHLAVLCFVRLNRNQLADAVAPFSQMLLPKNPANGIGHILRSNRLLKHVIEGKTEGRIEVPGRQGRSRKQLLDDLK
jgi:hypothetical protein